MTTIQKMNQVLGPTATSMAAGAATAALKGLKTKEAVVISAAAGLASTATHLITNRFGSKVESNTLLKVIVSASTVLATFGLIYSGSNLLAKHFGLVIDSKMMSYLTVANIAGQTIYLSFFSGKPPLTAEVLEKLDAAEVQILHDQLQKKPEQFDELPLLVQVFLPGYFEEAGLEEVKSAPTLTKELVGKLTSDEVAYLHRYKVETEGENVAPAKWTSIVTDDKARKALIVRFLEQKLSKEPLLENIDAFKAALAELHESSIFTKDKQGMLKTTKALGTYFAKLFDDKEFKPYFGSISFEAQCAILTASPEHDITKCTFAEDRLKDTSKEVIELFKHLSVAQWVKIDPDSQALLNEQFAKHGFEEKTLHPESKEEVNALPDDQVKIYHKDFDPDILDKNLCKALMRRFYDMGLDFKVLPKEAFTAELISDLPLPKKGSDVESIPEEKLPVIHYIYSKALDAWHDLEGLTSNNRQINLNKAFADAKLPELFIIGSRRQPNEISEDKIDVAHYHYWCTTQGLMSRFYADQQKALNDAFKKLELVECAVRNQYWAAIVG